LDVFGTVLDWRRGLRDALGGRLSDAAFDRIVDRQGELEQQGFRRYADIVAQSLVEELALGAEEAARIGAAAGTWPLFSDSASGLRRLRAVAPCAAITNSDLAHRAQVEEQLYDHRTARSLGLTCVFVERPHSRPGPADRTVGDLSQLADQAR
jgi:hypothetical protein